MLKKGRFLAMSILACTCVVRADQLHPRIAIIKADDIRRPTEKWDRFFELSEAQGVKVSAGIICETLGDRNPEYIAWLLRWQDTGFVEFWNHGWDHKRWTDQDGNPLREFSGTGYEHQKRHFTQSQDLLKEVLGRPSIAFGAPYNAMDADTVRVFNEAPEMRLLFGYPRQKVEGILLAPMLIRGESDGTGKPNFEQFKADYHERENLSFMSIQFHPNNFDDTHFAEYAKILDFLLAEGWTFVLPQEYVDPR